ncbi:MAG: quinone-dependent dihydroorotate dehydrogenase [Bacteroidetes bacterium]|nr:quinone-dependent dihydroorotate dehydrogenase [Bacteroidota bacterium]
MYKRILKPVFFLFPPEAIHHIVFGIIWLFFKVPTLWWFVRKFHTIENQKLKRTVMGIDFSNPVGLAAGFDKNAELFDELSCLGFGFIEIGTVTPLAQPGNEKPRMFRLPADEALINRMGFNNDGVKKIAQRLKKRKSPVIIGGNIGKNKLTPNENAVDDYETCFRELYEVVDYFVVNVSSPNTPGLRELQEKEPLKKILFRLQEVNAEMSGGVGSGQPAVFRKPILLKIAPDLTNEQLDDIIEIVLETKLDGVVATNTTLSRSGLKTSPSEIEKIGAGGLSGKPLAKRSTEIIRYLHKKSNGKFVIIGSGGIHSPEDAKEKLDAGASLIQVYTGFVYEGPGLVKRINKSLFPVL